MLWAECLLRTFSVSNSIFEYSYFWRWNGDQAPIFSRTPVVCKNAISNYFFHHRNWLKLRDVKHAFCSILTEIRPKETCIVHIAPNWWIRFFSISWPMTRRCSCCCCWRTTTTTTKPVWYSIQTLCGTDVRSNALLQKSLIMNPFSCRLLYWENLEKKKFVHCHRRTALSLYTIYHSLCLCGIWSEKKREELLFCSE